MKTITLNIKDEAKYLSFLQFIEQLDFIELEKPAKKKSTVEKYDFFASAGLWKGKDIDAKKLRTRAWSRQI
jgi:hypothetical protein